MGSDRQRSVLLPLGLLVAGAALYLLRREPVAAVTWLLGDRRVLAWQSWAEWVAPLRIAMPAALHAHGADALFAASVSTFLSLLWPKSTTALLAGLSFVVALEIGQRAGIIPGTFDPLDVVADVAAYVAALGLRSLAHSVPKERTLPWTS